MTAKTDAPICGNCAHFLRAPGADTPPRGFCKELNRGTAATETCGFFFVTLGQVNETVNSEKTKEPEEKPVDSIGIRADGFYRDLENQKRLDAAAVMQLHFIMTEWANRNEEQRDIYARLFSPGFGLLYTRPPKKSIFEAARILQEAASLGVSRLVHAALENTHLFDALMLATKPEGYQPGQPKKGPTVVSPEEAAAIAAPIIGKGHFENGKWIQDPDLPPPGAAIVAELFNKGPSGRMAAAVSMGVRVSEDICDACEAAKNPDLYAAGAVSEPPVVKPDLDSSCSD